MKIRILTFLLCSALILTGCHVIDNSGDKTHEDRPESEIINEETQGNHQGSNHPESGETEAPGDVADLGDDNKTFGDDLDALGAYDGYFEGDSANIEIKCISGTDKAYKLEGTTLTFTEIGEKTVYSISGTFRGNIVIDVGDSYKFDLELHGLSIVCNYTNPITIKSMI